MVIPNKKFRGRVGVSSLLWVTKMRVAALYLVAAAFVIAMSTPGPHPYVSGGALAVSVDENKPFQVAARWDDREFGMSNVGRAGFDADFGRTVALRREPARAADAPSHPAAKRHAELSAMLSTMPPPSRSVVQIEAEMATVRQKVDERQQVFDGLASELDVLRVELSQMDRRETATEIAARIDATQSQADSVRSSLVHSLVELTSAQAELRNARRYEDLQQELVALEELMMSVRVYMDEGDEAATAASASGMGREFLRDPR